MLVCSSVARQKAISSNGWADAILGRMQQRTTSETDNAGDNPADRARAPIMQRLWRNQLGIALAVALTLAAIVILLATYRG